MKKNIIGKIQEKIIKYKKDTFTYNSNELQNLIEILDINFKVVKKETNADNIKYIKEEMANSSTCPSYVSDTPGYSTELVKENCRESTSYLMNISRRI